MPINNFYITTPIYYPSGNPHMGHAYSSIVADVFARFKRLEGKNVFFLTGTDEHGLKIQREAKKNNKDVKIFCDEVSNKFKDLTKILNLSIDDFIRTTEKRHHRSVQAIWNKLLESGDIYLSKYAGWYSISDEAYYTEDEIIDDKGKKKSKSSDVNIVELKNNLINQKKNELFLLYSRSDLSKLRNTKFIEYYKWEIIKI